MTSLNKPVRLWQLGLVVAATLILAVVGSAIAGSGSTGSDRLEKPDGVQAAAKQTVGGKTYVREQYVNAAGQTQFGNAKCPSGKEVVGGGIATQSTTQDVNATQPYDAGDSNSAPDDGWRAWVQNNSGSSARAEIHAICD